MSSTPSTCGAPRAIATARCCCGSRITIGSDRAPEYEASILEDLTWLGFVHDGDIVRQSERERIYRKALQPLIDRELVYGCTCTRAEIRRDPGSGIRDPGSPLSEHLPRQGHSARPTTSAGACSWSPASSASSTRSSGRRSRIRASNAAIVLVRDRLGNWTYQFAVTVDDHVQRITDVIRGDDLLSSTGRQIRLARLLGRATPPRFWHHPLVMKSPAQKLSKSDGDTGVRDLRASGWTAESRSSERPAAF